MATLEGLQTGEQQADADRRRPLDPRPKQPASTSDDLRQQLPGTPTVCTSGTAPRTFRTPRPTPPAARSPVMSCRPSSTTLTMRSNASAPPAERAGSPRSAPPCSRSPTATGYAREFGDYDVCYVRHGKAMKGSPPKRRSVLTIWSWTVDVLDEWITTVRPLVLILVLGLRKGEILGLCWDNVDLDAPTSPSPNSSSASAANCCTARPRPKAPTPNFRYPVSAPQR
jgi:hypothetical protein